MTKTLIKKLILSFALVFVVLIMPLVSADINIQKYAVSYDFFSGAELANPEVCSCSSLIDKIAITNIGSFGAVFTVETNIPDIARVPFNQVTLEPGRSANVDIIIEAVCGVEDEIDYDVIIKSNLNREQVISRTLRINQCQSLDASLFVDKNSILPCEPLKYNIQIQNPSTFIETYRVEPLNFLEFFDGEAYEITISPGQTGVVETELSLSCELYGNQSVNFRVTSLNNELFTDLSHELEVVQDYGFDAIIPEDLVVCEDVSTELEIELSNNARFENSYTLSLEGNPDFVRLDNNRIDLMGGDSEFFNIIALPGINDVGAYNFEVKIVSDLGNQVLEKNITLQVNECFKAFIEIESQENPDLCADEHVFNAKVRNDGKFDEKIYLTLDAPNAYGSLSDSVLELSPGEEEDVQINLVVPGELDGETLPVTLTANLQERETLKFWFDTIEPKVHSQYMCTFTTPLKTKLYVPYSGDETFIGIVNKGIVESKYDLSLEGNDKISFEDDAITVPAGETRFVKINVNFNDEDPRNNFYAVTLTAENGVEYKYDFRVIRTNGAFIENVWDYFKVSNCKIIMLVLVILLVIAIVLFFVKLFIEGSSWKGLWNYRLILILLALLAILSVWIFFGLPQSIATPLNESDPLSIQWYEDDVKILDLDNYFNDPDADTLTYEISGREPDNISVDIEGSKVTLISEQDWFGNKRIRFEATDTDGESVTSPRLTLEVVEVTRLTFSELIAIYCVYINLLLILLILLFLIFTPWTNRKSSEGKVKVTGISKEKGYHYYVDSNGDISRRVTKRKK